ncbi:snRNA-activating protein complex subunit 1-like [Synchiropus splendidus]|uniref:snRNA-activating protein complex subunit 1-like n=1 Tax=Synchiropus splendidus TaxID=270530 RepID=UPI00237D5BDE|nr:snRNA-activating protein complex subunit 1-like [Synchiropus splendidus]XP_053735198.1 snRNA-activating protein complex subunit 1-like [Synchiropus splendidus]
MPTTTVAPSDCFYDSLAEDVEELLGRFQQTESIRFKDFSAIWREMSFSDVFIGLNSMSEAKRFSMVAMATSLKYFLPPYSFQIRVGALYLMFGFHKTQQASPPVPVRLPLKDMAAVEKFIEDSEVAGHHDVVYIYHKLLSEKALSFTAMPELLDYTRSRKPKKAVCEELIGRTTAVQELLSSERLEELNNIQAHYETMKKNTAEVSQQAAVTHRDFADQLHGCLLDFADWQLKTFSKPMKSEAAESPSCSRAKLLSSIKHKSYTNCPDTDKSRRHRKVEMADSSWDQVAKPRRKRPPSLQSRTRLVLDVKPEKHHKQTWLLCAPDEELEKTRGVRNARRSQQQMH